MITWENAAKGLCVVCGKAMGDPGVYVCEKCKQPCYIKLEEVPGQPDPTSMNGTQLMRNAISVCCKADVAWSKALTCSAPCHEAFITEMERDFGKFKRVVNVTTGVSYRVPTRDVIEKGLKWEDLKKYPVWTGGIAG